MGGVLGFGQQATLLDDRAAGSGEQQATTTIAMLSYDRNGSHLEIVRLEITLSRVTVSQYTVSQYTVSRHTVISGYSYLGILYLEMYHLRIRVSQDAPSRDAAASRDASISRYRHLDMGHLKTPKRHLGMRHLGMILGHLKTGGRGSRRTCAPRRAKRHG